MCIYHRGLSCFSGTNGRSVTFWYADCAIVIIQNKWKIRLQLTKPVTWPPLVWGVVCGAAASGNLVMRF